MNTGILGKLFTPLRSLWRRPAGTLTAKIEQALTDAGGPAAGYKPRLPVQLFTGQVDGGLPPLHRFYADLPAMLKHHRVALAMWTCKSGVSGAKFKVEASCSAVQRFVGDLLDRFWSEWLDQTHDGYEWGWVGCDCRYTDEQGLFTLASVEAYEPSDVTALEIDGNYVGFRVKNVTGESHADLWGPSHAPSRGFWYAHRARKGMYYGLSQCYPAWRPWARLAGRDGAEEFIDGGVYRFAYAGIVGRYPVEDNKSSKQPAGASGERVSNRDKMLAFAEGAKAGVNVALPSTRDEKGEYKWGVEWPQRTLDVDSLIGYAGRLEKSIDAGCGVPSELVEAAETGSGYSGRAIPLEAFFLAQQSVATSIMRQVMTQLVLPLVRWNYGPHAWARSTVEPLLATRRQATGGGPARVGPEKPPPPSAIASRPAARPPVPPKAVARLATATPKALARRVAPPPKSLTRLGTELPMVGRLITEPPRPPVPPILINLTVPPMPAPTVNVTLPTVNVNLPESKADPVDRRVELQFDADGNASGAIVTESVKRPQPTVRRIKLEVDKDGNPTGATITSAGGWRPLRAGGARPVSYAGPRWPLSTGADAEVPALLPPFPRTVHDDDREWHGTPRTRLLKRPHHGHRISRIHSAARFPTIAAITHLAARHALSPPAALRHCATRTAVRTLKQKQSQRRSQLA